MIAEDETTYVDFELTTAPYGIVMGYADLTDTPGADAGIDIYSSRGGYVATTAADGSFIITDFMRGDDYFLNAEYPTYLTVSTPLFNVAAGETTYVDTLFLTRGGMTTGEFCFDFDGTESYLTPETPATWEWGAPTLTTAHSVPNVWGTRLGANYVDLADWSLWVDFSAMGVSNVTEITYWQWYNMENGYDGGVVDVSTDGGATWTRLTPTPGYTGTISTYFSSPIAGEMAYTGTSGAWEEVTLDLASYPTATHVRFRFCSDNSISSYPGWYIDDMCLTGESYDDATYSGFEGYVYDNETYEVIPGALVYSESGYMTYTDEDGYFHFDNLPVGLDVLYAAKTGYFTNDVEIAVNSMITLSTMIPLSPVNYSPGAPVISHIPYDHEEDVPTITFCNTSDEEVDYYFGPWEAGMGGLLRTREIDNSMFVKQNQFPLGYDTEAMVNPNATYSHRRFNRSMDMGDILEAIPVTGGIDIAWGLGLLGLWETDLFWVSDVTGTGTGYIREYTREGAYTGNYFDFMAAFPGIAWVGDMTWDGSAIWVAAVGGPNCLYKLDPETFAVLDSIVDPTPASGWGSTSQRGVAYDHVEDVFYVGGWNSNMLWKIKGKSWDVPGEEIDAGITADGCAGIGFHASRRTVWFTKSNVNNTIVEVDYETGFVLNEFDLDFLPDYSTSGLEVDGEGQIWVVDQNGNQVLILDSGFGLLPDGVYFDPNSGTLAPGECVTINLHTEGHTAHVGRYEFDGYLFLDDNVDPITIPMVIEVAPTLEIGWNIVSVPVAAVPNDPWVQLHDDISPFDVASGGQLYAWDPILGRYTLPSGFERGRGYYLWGWHADTKFDVWGAEYTEDMIMNLASYPDASMPNWHVIGNPFNRRIDWDDVTGDPAFANINPTAWFFSTQTGWMTYTPGMPPMGMSNEFDPWTGWWVKVESAEGGTIPFRNDYTYESLLKPGKAKEKSDGGLGDFALRISVAANTAEGWKFDKYNYIATDDEAIDAFDNKDHEAMAAAPMGAEPISASFVMGAARLKDDIRSTFHADESKTWSLEITDLEPGTPVVLSWPLESSNDPNDGSIGTASFSDLFNFTMTHPVTGEEINMKETKEVTFIYEGAVTVDFHVFTMILGTGDAQIPDHFAMSQNYPNPFNAVTAIKVAIPEDAEVTLEVFNVMGQRVRTIVDGEQMSAGYHNVIWDGMTDKGTRTASGVYLYKMTTPQFKETKKMILVK